MIYEIWNILYCSLRTTNFCFSFQIPLEWLDWFLFSNVIKASRTFHKRTMFNNKIQRLENGKKLYSHQINCHYHPYRTLFLQWPELKPWIFFPGRCEASTWGMLKLSLICMFLVLNWCLAVFLSADLYQLFYTFPGRTLILKCW